MKIVPCEQGTPQWLEARRGIPTASEFAKIITPVKMELSKQARPYAIRLVTETLLNRSLETLEGLEWIEHGKAHEADAAKFYEFERDETTVPIGFVTTDDGRIGASPDRLVGEDGLLEIKCPAPATHLGYIIDGFNLDYRCQVQGQLLVTGRAWCDWMSYSYEMPPVLIRIDRDEEFIGRLQAALDQFCDMRDELLATARSRGEFLTRARFESPVEEFVEQLDRR